MRHTEPDYDLKGALKEPFVELALALTVAVGFLAIVGGT
jgi:hypothetical protein